MAHSMSACILDSYIGLQISSVQTPLTIGDTVSIVCSTDLYVTTIEWIRDGITVVNSSSQPLTLLLDPVSADHHNTQYTCRVTSLFGIQEETIDITVRSKVSCLCNKFNLDCYIRNGNNELIVNVWFAVFRFSPPVLGHSPDQLSS